MAVAAVSLLPFSAFGQAHYESRVYFGAHGGLDLSRVAFTPGIPQQFLPGGNVGINFRYIEEKHFGLVAELNWEQRGWKEAFDGLNYSYSRTADYIHVPVLAQIYFGRRGKFFINLGPSVSFLTRESTKSNFDYRHAASLPDFRSRIYHQYNEDVALKFDYGILGGLGGEFSINPRNSIYLEARYYFGLGNLLKSGRTRPIRGANPMCLSIDVGYWFRLK